MSGSSPAITDATFLGVFPEFNDASKYPGTQRTFFLTQALNVLDACKWCDYYEMGVYLYVAHHLVLFSGNGTRRTRQRPGMPPMLTNSKSVGGVSVSYDTQSITNKDGSHWNATTFGIRWLDLARMVGVGVEQIGWGPIPPEGASWGYFPQGNI